MQNVKTAQGLRRTLKANKPEANLEKVLGMVYFYCENIWLYHTVEFRMLGSTVCPFKRMPGAEGILTLRRTLVSIYPTVLQQ